MKHTDKELSNIKIQISNMWNLVISQLEKTKIALLTNNHDLAREIVSKEKRVDALELSINKDCENYIALYNPVAVDLRFILSVIKIGITLERIADFCKSISKNIIKQKYTELSKELKESLNIEIMLDTVSNMLKHSFKALESENTQFCGKILSMDDKVDEIYHNSFKILEDYLKKDIQKTSLILDILILIRKIERIGDHCSNNIEEIVFYIEAKVWKHSKNISN